VPCGADHVLTDRVIGEGSLRVDDAGLSFDIRIPWYRSLPLSCVEGLEVTVDGHSIPQDAMRLTFDDATYALDELPPLHDTWWHVTDPARVTIARSDGAAVGPHEIDVTLSMRIPYIVEEGRRLVMRERCVKTLAASAES
jgi:hypothetical protein